MAQECQMVGRDYGHHIAWNIFAVKIVHSMAMMCNVLSAEFRLYPIKRV
jgi:hypothetical protein